MNIKKMLSIVSILILLSFSLSINASYTSENRKDNEALATVLVIGLAIYAIRLTQARGKDNYTLAYHESFTEGKGITLAGKSLTNKEAKFRLSTLSSDIEQKEVFQDSFFPREEKSFSINLLKIEF